MPQGPRTRELELTTIRSDISIASPFSTSLLFRLLGLAGGVCYDDFMMVYLFSLAARTRWSLYDRSEYPAHFHTCLFECVGGLLDSALAA